MSTDAALSMDRMYRAQRHIYDLTRKPYLLGRDGMIAGLLPPAGAAVLEIGCGTGRNLVKAAQLFPAARCFGLDVSARMLETARGAIARAGLDGKIAVVQADATNFDAAALFGQSRFERVFISYSLSMIPDWRQVLASAALHLAPGGSLHIVDFGQQEGLPHWFKAGLARWLGWFAVHPRADLPEAAQEVAAREGLACVVTRPLRGYAVQVVLSRPSGPL